MGHPVHTYILVVLGLVLCIGGGILLATVFLHMIKEASRPVQRVEQFLDAVASQ